MAPLPKRFQTKIDEISKDATDAEWLSTLTELVMSREPKPRTQVNRYSIIKQYIKEKHGKTFPTFRPPSKLIDEVLKKDLDTRTNKESFSVDKELLDAIDSVKGKDTYVDQIIDLMVSSGRRINEIVDREITYKRVPKKTDMIRASHLSKQREKPKSAIIQLRGMTSTEFQRKLKHVRDATSEDSLTSVNAMVNRRLKKLDKRLTSSHKLRGIYALLLWHDSGRVTNLNGFIQKALNQSSADASLNYSNYILED